MCTVGTSECIGWFVFQFVFYSLQITGRNDAIGVEHDDILSLATFYTIVTRLSGAGIWLFKIVNVQKVIVFFYNVSARNGRTVFNHDYFEVAIYLMRKAF